MPCSCNCNCGDKEENKTLWTCSGAANTGLLADKVSRYLSVYGFGALSCLSGLGADIDSFNISAKKSKNIVIDGCPVGCAKKIFENKGLDFEQILMTDFDVKKGETVITDELVRNIAQKIINY